MTTPNVERLENLIKGLELVAGAYVTHSRQIALAMETGEELLKRMSAVVEEMKKEAVR